MVAGWRLFYACGQHAEMKFDASMGKPVAHSKTQIIVKTAQHIFAARNKRDVRAEPRENRSELDRDIAATNNQHTLWQCRKIENFVRGDRIFAPRNIRFEHWRPARADKDNSCAQFAAIGNKTHTMRIHDFGAAVFDGDACLVEIVAIDRGEAGDFLLLCGDERRPIEGSRGKRPAEPRGIHKMVLEPACIDQELFRHAAPDHARPANAEFLRDHNPGTMGCRDPRGAHAAGPRADHEEIDIVASHSTSSTQQPDNDVIA